MLHRGILEGRRASGNMMKYLLMGTSSNFGNMFSMAAASVFLPFLPMLPTQILLNNFLYDLAQVTIPTDNVDETYLRRPQRWDMRVIRDFMLFIGPISSIFDFLTFYVLLRVFHAGESLFHTGWFVESLATQTLVLFVIRTMGNPFRSRPSRAADGHDARGRRHRCRAAGDTAGRPIGVHRVAGRVPCLPAGGHADVSRPGRCREAAAVPVTIGSQASGRG